MNNIEVIDYDFAFDGERILLVDCKICKKNFFTGADDILKFCPCCGRKVVVDLYRKGDKK